MRHPCCQFWTLLTFICFSGYFFDCVCRHGPFVMNHPLEIQQAFADYRSGKLQNPDDNPWLDDEL